MIYGLLGLLLASALTLPSWAADEEKTTIVPVTKAPFHMFTFQDENMALENVTLPAGRSTTYHSHNQDLFFVIIKGAKIKNQVLEKDPVDIDFKQGMTPRFFHAVLDDGVLTVPRWEMTEVPS